MILAIQVPAGSAPGSAITVAAPDGRHVQISIPPGIQPGQTIQVEIPDAEPKEPSPQEQLVGMGFDRSDVMTALRRSGGDFDGAFAVLTQMQEERDEKERRAKEREKREQEAREKKARERREQAEAEARKQRVAAERARVALEKAEREEEARQRRSSLDAKVKAEKSKVAERAFRRKSSFRGEDDDDNVAAASAAEPPSAARLVGKRVRIEGLASNPELNGLHGTAVGFISATGRYSVTAVGGTNDGKNFALKPANLVELPNQDAESTIASKPAPKVRSYSGPAHTAGAAAGSLSSWNAGVPVIDRRGTAAAFAAALDGVPLGERHINYQARAARSCVAYVCARARVRASARVWGHERCERSVRRAR